MYVYIVMERTQIYLTEMQTHELDKRARQQGTTRSHLIREAVEKYLTPDWDPEAFKAALNRFAGIWADRDDLDEIRASMREAERRKRERLFPDLYSPEADDPDHRR
jgi:Arc/MetJ-type ribon-helix-helix transcriptional regulator